LSTHILITAMSLDLTYMSASLFFWLICLVLEISAYVHFGYCPVFKFDWHITDSFFLPICLVLDIFVYALSRPLGSRYLCVRTCHFSLTHLLSSRNLCVRTFSPTWFSISLCTYILVTALSLNLTDTSLILFYLFTICLVLENSVYAHSRPLDSRFLWVRTSSLLPCL
jgi:hypothetical protein